MRFNTTNLRERQLLNITKKINYYNKIFFLFFVFLVRPLLAQKDSLRVGDRYWEDQLYLSITYNVLKKQPNVLINSGFSYGFSAGYVKDVPFNIRGNWSAGIGVGYNYDSFNHGLVFTEAEDVINDNNVTDNKVRLHNVEFPIQLRWRTSDAVTYSFWRFYAGVRLSYNFSNTFKYKRENQNYNFSNIDSYNHFQTGLELSAGYGAFNFFMYYGLTPMYKSISIENKKINTRVAKFGLIFYLL